MSTEPNSMRLQRLTKTMDLHTNRSASLFDNTSEVVKLPALRAINKSIKYNDLSFATSRDLSKLRKQPDQVDNIQEVSAHHTLVTMRKKYDNLSKNRQEKQKQVDKLQAQHDKLTSQKNLFESQKNGGKQYVNQLYTNLSSIKLQLQEAQIERKIMLNMMSRLKSDKVTYDLRKYNMEKQLSKTHKYMKLIHEENKKHKEDDDKTQKMKLKLINHINNQKRQRDNHLYHVQSILNQKEAMITNEETRYLQMQQIASSTLQDKDSRQKNWYKVYLCTRFVQRLLRDKMNRQMLKFNIVQVAFKNIKTSTGVNSAESLVKKFLNKQNTYGQLLSQIASNEKNISSLKFEGDQLRKQASQLQAEQEQLDATQIQTQDLSREQRQLTIISEKNIKCQAYKQKLASWLTRNLKKYDIKQDEQSGVLQDSSNFTSQFKIYLETINKNLDSLIDCQIETQDSDVKLTQNNRRIKFTVEDQSEPLDHKIVQHQEEWIDGERLSVIKNNDKFMKELKKKYEQIKKAKIEAQPKKKEIIVEKPKPPPVQI